MSSRSMQGIQPPSAGRRLAQVRREPCQGESLAAELLVDAVTSMDPLTQGEVFCRRLCKTFLDSTPMRRVAIALADGTHGTTCTTAGAHGSQAGEGGVPLVEPVVRIEPRREPWQSEVGVTTVAPLSLGGRWLGAVFADRGGEAFVLTTEEQRLLAGVGRMIGVAAGTWLAMARRSEALLAEERTQLAQQIHDRVVQDLFGVSLVLAAPSALSNGERASCEESLSGALGELDGILSGRIEACERAPAVEESIDLGSLRRRYADLPATWHWSAPTTFSPGRAALVRDFLDESLRNVRKHARPRTVEVLGSRSSGGTAVEVRNDGRVPSRPGRQSGLGLRLLAVRARQHGAVIESRALPSGRWRASLWIRGGGLA
jgi:nitrate/nitrite-specific signal transduction histidine kinase